MLRSGGSGCSPPALLSSTGPDYLPGILVEVDPNRRILLMCRELGAGGSERQLAETAKALHRNGWTTHVGCFHDSGMRADELRAAGIPVVRFPVTSFANSSVLNGLACFGRYAVQHRIALTHSFDMPLNIFGTFAARLSGRRVVISSQRCYRSLYTKREQQWLRVTDKIVSGIVVNCKAIRRHLTEDENVPAARIHLCYNGIDTDTFSPAPRRLPEFPADTIVIGTVAVLRAEKGLPTLVEAFARVHADEPSTRLLIVGSGPLRGPLEEQAKSLGVASAVRFQPATADPASWLNSMDVYVLPSLSEALSNSLMEAMACAVAPVASAVGGNPELIVEGESGFLFPRGDAAALADRIRCLVKNEPLRKRVAASARSFIASEMNVARCVTRMSEIYAALLQS